MSPKRTNVLLLKGSARELECASNPTLSKVQRLRSLRDMSSDKNATHKIIDKNTIGKIPLDRYNKFMTGILDNLELKDREDNSCLVCCERPSNVVFHPCYHGNICDRCAVSHLATQSRCLICRSVDICHAESQKAVSG